MVILVGVFYLKSLFQFKIDVGALDVRTCFISVLLALLGIAVI